VTDAGIHRTAVVHPTAVLDDGVVIERDAKVWHFVHVSSGARIGEGTSLGQNAFVGRGVVVGARVKVQNNVSIYEGVTVEDDVFLGPGVIFTNDMKPRAHIKRSGDALLPTLVRRGATIGAGAVVVCGITIGEHAFVGAGSVVTRDVARHSFMVGNPGRRIAWACICGERLPGSLECADCGRRYAESGSSIELVADGATGGS
jgi:UDP-2-acetamido-3-amino-2,3-dideoxy-glucuronate N-acetyltransferase